MVGRMPRLIHFCTFAHVAFRDVPARARTTPGTLAFLPTAR
jgi:hypothetical protein